MTLRFDWLHWLHWHPHASRAMSVVLGVIGISLLFGALRVVDGAVSGALGEVSLPPSAAVARSAESVLLTDPPAAGAPQDANLVDVPAASADAISL